jgi:hypothetical protein
MITIATIETTVATHGDDSLLFRRRSRVFVLSIEARELVLE